jgi:hypothetical protein
LLYRITVSDCSAAFPRHREISLMLETLAVILVVMWVMGLLSSYTMGGFIHVLLVVAVIVVLVRLIQGRRI